MEHPRGRRSTACGVTAAAMAGQSTRIEKAAAGTFATVVGLTPVRLPLQAQGTRIKSILPGSAETPLSHIGGGWLSFAASVHAGAVLRRKTPSSCGYRVPANGRGSGPERSRSSLVAGVASGLFGIAFAVVAGIGGIGTKRPRLARHGAAVQSE